MKAVTRELPIMFRSTCHDRRPFVRQGKNAISGLWVSARTDHPLARDPAHPLSRSQVSLGRITSLAAQIGGLLSGQTEKHLLILSLTAFEPKRFAYRP